MVGAKNIKAGRPAIFLPIITMPVVVMPVPTVPVMPARVVRIVPVSVMPAPTVPVVPAVIIVAMAPTVMMPPIAMVIPVAKFDRTVIRTNGEKVSGTGVRSIDRRQGFRQARHGECRHGHGDRERCEEARGGLH